MKSNNSNKYSKPGWLILTLPVFFLALWKFDILIAAILGLGTLAITFVTFVWVSPDQYNRLSRKESFKQIKQDLASINKLINRIGDIYLKQDLKNAQKIASGIFNELKNSDTHMGELEESFPSIVESMKTIIERWLMHETGEQPLPSREIKTYKEKLSNIDSLLLESQQKNISTLEVKKALINLDMRMRELGINPESKPENE